MPHTAAASTQYKTCCVLGQGAYGTVLKARHVENGTYHAIKRVKTLKTTKNVRVPKVLVSHCKLHASVYGERCTCSETRLYMQMPRDQTREIAALRALQQRGQHPNIVRLDDVVRDEESLHVHLVLELCTRTLAELIDTAAERHSCSTAGVGDGLGVGRSETLVLMQDIARALEHCHELGLIHRDLKPQNVLLCANGRAKLCDFGMACTVAFERPLTPQMITRWYRAPEVLLDSLRYGLAVDVWALGCIVLEMCWLCPPFVGHTEIEMLKQIFDAFGVPSAVHDSPVLFEYARRGSIVPKRIAQCGELAAVLGQMLELEPHARPTAAAVLATATDLLAQKHKATGEDVHASSSAVRESLCTSNAQGAVKDAKKPQATGEDVHASSSAVRESLCTSDAQGAVKHAKKRKREHMLPPETSTRPSAVVLLTAVPDF